MACHIAWLPTCLAQHAAVTPLELSPECARALNTQRASKAGFCPLSESIVAHSQSVLIIFPAPVLSINMHPESQCILQQHS